MLYINHPNLNSDIYNLLLILIPDERFQVESNCCDYSVNLNSLILQLNFFFKILMMLYRERCVNFI